MKKLIALLALLAPAAFAAPTVNLIAVPDAGVAPLSVTLTWTSSGAATCVASGAWSGTKALNGSQTFSSVTSDKTYTLTCSEGTGTAVLSWTPPSTNTDGSPLTDLSAYVVHRAPSVAELEATTNKTEVTAPASGFTLTVPTGTWYFGVKARNAAGVLSVMSNTASKNVVGASAAATATVDITTQPNPPVLNTVIAAIYEIRGCAYKGCWLARKIGTAPIGTECFGSMLINYTGAGLGDYYRVDKLNVTLLSGINPTSVTGLYSGRCA